MLNQFLGYFGLEINRTDHRYHESVSENPQAEPSKDSTKPTVVKISTGQDSRLSTYLPLHEEASQRHNSVPQAKLNENSTKPTVVKIFTPQGPSQSIYLTPSEGVNRFNTEHRQGMLSVWLVCYLAFDNCVEIFAGLQQSNEAFERTTKYYRDEDHSKPHISTYHHPALDFEAPLRGGQSRTLFNVQDAVHSSNPNVGIAYHDQRERDMGNERLGRYPLQYGIRYVLYLVFDRLSHIGHL